MTDLTPEKREAISNEMKAWVRARQPRPRVDPIDSVMLKMSAFFGAVIVCLIAWWAIWGAY